MVDGEPLSKTAARDLARRILAQGRVSYSRHAIDRMQQRNMTTVDVANVLRGGWCECSEHENGTWRYRIVTNKMVVVAAFRSESELRVITAMRIEP